MLRLLGEKVREQEKMGERMMFITRLEAMGTAFNHDVVELKGLEIWKHLV